VVLGYLDPENFLGGRLDPEAARRSWQYWPQLGMETVAAAAGIMRSSTAVWLMELALPLRRGVDPRRLTLLVFGGAAGCKTEVAADWASAGWQSR
jgi:N-methylhydantoinase A/oxoprolinase/acetone carboxylase beta subunit